MALEETLSLNVEFGDLDRLQAELGESQAALAALGKAASQASLGFDKLTGSAAQAGQLADQFRRNFQQIQAPKISVDAGIAQAQADATKLREIAERKAAALAQIDARLNAQIRAAQEKATQARITLAETEASRLKFIHEKAALEEQRAAARLTVRQTSKENERQAARLNKLLAESRREMDKTAATAQKTGSAFDNFFKQFGFSGASILRMTSAFILAEVGIRTFTQAISSMNRFFREGIAGAGQEEEAIARLANAFKLTGAASAGAVADAVKLADALALTTTATDDQVIAVEALLVQFGKLKGDQLKQATELTFDLAVALGRTSDEIAEVLAKAAQGNLTALGRLIGRDAIENVRSFNDLLAQLQSTVGGTAAAAAATASGSLKQLNKSFQELKETLGAAVLPGLGGFSAKLTVIFNQIATGIKQLGAVTPGTAPELLAAFGTMLSNLEGQVGDARKKITDELNRIEEAAPKALKLSIESGDLDAALREIAQMEQVAATSTAATDARFQALFQHLRQIAREAIPVNIDLRSENLQADFRNVLRSLRGESGLEILLKGSADFREAEAAFLGLRTKEEGDPITLAVDVKSPELATLDARLAKLQERVKSLAAAAAADPGIEKLLAAEQRAVARLIAERERLVATLREAPAVSRFAQEFIQTTRVRIDAANSEGELRAILADLEKQFLELSVKPDKHAVAEGVRQTIQFARAEIAAQKDLLKAPIGLEFVKPKDLAFESALGSFLDLVQKIQTATAIPPGEIFNSAQIIRDAEDSTAALAEFSAAVDAAVERRDLGGLTAAAEAMEQFLRATADAAADDKDLQKLRANVEKAMSGVRAAIDTATPFFKAEDFEVRIHAALDAKDIPSAERLLDTFRAFIEEHPELEVRVNLQALENQILQARQLLGPLTQALELKTKIDLQLGAGDLEGASQTREELERLLVLHPEIKPQFDSSDLDDLVARLADVSTGFQVSMQVLDNAIDVTTTAFTGGFKAAADQIKKIIVDLVAFIIKRLAVLAILNAFIPGFSFLGGLRNIFGKTAPIPVPVIPTPVSKLSLPPLNLPVTIEAPRILPVVLQVLPPEIPAPPQMQLEFLLPPLPEFEPIRVPVEFETPQIPQVRFPKLDFPEFAPPDLGAFERFQPARVILPTQEFSRQAAREAAVRVAQPAPSSRPEPESILRRRTGADVEVTFQGTFDGESVRRQLQSGAMNRELLRIARRGRL